MLQNKYRRVFKPINSSMYTVQGFDYRWGVVDDNDNIIVEFGKYQWIDGFHNGLAKVVSHDDNVNSQWETVDEAPVAAQGIINEKGEEILPLEYNIWKFYGKDYPSIVAVKDGCKYRFTFSELKGIVNSSHSSRSWRDDDNDDYGTHYGEFEGSYAQDVMGYSDDVINDAFDGDPDAYWNID